MPNSQVHKIAIIGAGPAGLMAAEQFSTPQGCFLRGALNGVNVDIFDAMPSVGRKFLMAGKGGMNITHSEALPAFIARYGQRAEKIAPLLAAFGPAELREWIAGLGFETFVGTSGRVFPTEMKAAPLLRAWLHRLRGAGVRFHVRHRWLGWQADGALRFATPQGEISLLADVVILALGGGSWAKLGSDGAWVPLLLERGIQVSPLRPSNCGFDVAWSTYFRERFAGSAIKPVIASVGSQSQQGEFNITENGLEGGLIYALSAPLRDVLEHDGKATLTLDLAPGRSLERLISDLSKPQGRDSLSNHLRRRVGIEGVKAALLREFSPNSALTVTDTLARAIKALPVPVIAPRPLDEAISTAGGVPFEVVNEQLMLNQLPGTFCAGEMLDWEAPTGGYLLTACFASGYVAGQGALNWLQRGSKWGGVGSNTDVDEVGH
ncbi:MAG: TIGR03862 family flavoprotein [Rhodocyclaceae bacterium]|nr:TIGR03862 family flavoprotein [Rhodocyclaceae bacterium]